MREAIIKLLEELKKHGLIHDIVTDMDDQVAFHTTGSEDDFDCATNLAVNTVLQNRFPDQLMWNECEGYAHEGSVSYLL